MANTATKAATANGKIVQIIGSVVDVEFPREGIPAVYEALKLVDQDLTLEVQQQLGDGIVRTIAMGASEGLKRGLGVKKTGAPITVPVGVGTLGRIMDVLGKPQDEGGPIKTEGFPADPPPGPGLRRTDRRPGPARDRHQGHRPARAVREGRQDRPVRRRRRRQDRQHARAHQQHREGAQRPFRVRRRRRAHPRGQRLLSRDDGVGRHRQEGPDELEGRDGVRPDERAAGQPPARRPHRPHDGGIFPRREAGRRQGPRRAALHRQHLPLHAGGHGSVRAARPHALRGGLPADARGRDGRAPGAHHLDQDRIDHLRAGDLRARGRPDRPVAGDDLRAPRCDRRAQRARSRRSASTRRWIRSTRRAASSTRS